MAVPAAGDSAITTPSIFLMDFRNSRIAAIVSTCVAASWLSTTTLFGLITIRRLPMDWAISWLIDFNARKMLSARLSPFVSLRGVYLFHNSRNSAALLALLGVPEDKVYEDYLRSNEYILPAYRTHVDRFVAAGGDPSGRLCHPATALGRRPQGQHASREGIGIFGAEDPGGFVRQQVSGRLGRDRDDRAIKLCRTHGVKFVHEFGF